MLLSMPEGRGEAMRAECGRVWPPGNRSSSLSPWPVVLPPLLEGGLGQQPESPGWGSIPERRKGDCLYRTPSATAATAPRPSDRGSDPSCRPRRETSPDAPARESPGGIPASRAATAVGDGGRSSPDRYWSRNRKERRRRGDPWPLPDPWNSGVSTDPMGPE